MEKVQKEGRMKRKNIKIIAGIVLLLAFAGMFCDKETGEVLTDLLQIHILELKKLPPESQNETGIIQWMRFMRGKNRKDFAKMAEQNEYIKEAYECLEKMI